MSASFGLDAEIEGMRHQHAEIQVPDPMRPAEEGDLLTIDYSVTVDGEMALFWAPLSQAIVFGLSFATVLTLIVTPAMLALPAHLREKLPTHRAGRRPVVRAQRKAAVDAPTAHAG